MAEGHQLSEEFERSHFAGLSEKTVRGHRSYLNNLKTFFANCPLDKVTVEMVETYRDQRRQYSPAWTAKPPDLETERPHRVVSASPVVSALPDSRRTQENAMKGPAPSHLPHRVLQRHRSSHGHQDHPRQEHPSQGSTCLPRRLRSNIDAGQRQGWWPTRACRERPAPQNEGSRTKLQACYLSRQIPPRKSRNRAHRRSSSDGAPSWIMTRPLQ